MRTTRAIIVSVQASNKSAANSPVKPSAPAGPARMVLAVPDESARGRKPVLRDEMAAVATKQQYPSERSPIIYNRIFYSHNCDMIRIRSSYSANANAEENIDQTTYHSFSHGDYALCHSRC
jgi:hypothetical protein